MFARGRVWFFGLFAIALGILTPLAIAEGIVRLFLPYHTGLQSMPVNDATPIYRFRPDQEFTYSRDWNFRIVTHRRTNNAGFVSDLNYSPTATSPLIAIIGDSMIEAVHVDYEETVHGRLNTLLGDTGRAYAFGAGFAPLSQYLFWAGYVAGFYRPDLMHINVVGNDFDQSLLATQQGLSRSVFAGMHYFVPDGSGGLKLRRVDLVKDPLRELLKKSALISYLVRNVHAHTAPERIKELAMRLFQGDKPVVHIANERAAADAERLAVSRHVVDEWLAALSEAARLPPERVIISVDAIRPQLYDPDALKTTEGSYFDLMRRYLIDRASRTGYLVIDLQSVFTQRHRRTGERFEWAFENHWNGNAHAALSDAVAALPVFRKVFGTKPARHEPRPPLGHITSPMQVVWADAPTPVFPVTTAE